MGEKVKRVLSFVDTATEKSGSAVSLLIIVIMVIMTIEVVSRYVFGAPTHWAWPIKRQLFGTFVLFAGVYALLHDRHIRVEMLYTRFPPKVKSIARVIALACFLVFIGVLIWQGARWAGVSIAGLERSGGTFRIPLYPFKTLIPVVALFFLLQGIAHFFRKKSAGGQ